MILIPFQKEMMEIISYIPFQQVGIEFLNRPDRITIKRDGRDPKTLLRAAYQQIDGVFNKARPSGTTPALEKIQQSLLRGQGVSIARYFFGDGLPNGYVDGCCCHQSSWCSVYSDDSFHKPFR